MTTVYAYDFADRPASLLARRPGRPDQPLATSAAYLPSGPLSSLTLGNGLIETRGFDDRYFPASLSLTGISELLDWSYSTDAVGNILSIADTLTPSASRTYGYQDVHYFLTRGDGPWGLRSWTYDKIGNRLTETRGAATDTYTYLPSSTGGRSPILSQIQLGAGGTRTYQFGPAGHLESVALGASSTLHHSDAAGRLSALENSGSPSGSTFRYDGRDYLTQAAAGSLPFQNGFETGDLCGWTAAVGASSAPTCLAQPTVQPTYSSEGLLHALQRNTAPERSLIFHFAGRPVAQLDLSGGTEIWTFLTTDHLGTPVAATGPGGALLWQGGFEPFGADWSSAAGAGVFLRFPGQWAEGAFGGGLYYNVHRWYEVETGRYTRPDPIRLLESETYYLYAQTRPTILTDLRGLQPSRDDRPPGAKYCSKLGDVDHCRCDNPRLDEAVEHVRSQEAAYCANKDNPRIEFTPEDQRGGAFPFPWFVPQGNPCVNRCICAHEELHWWQVRSPSREGWSDNARECEAYKLQKRCLAEAKRNARPLNGPWIGIIPIM